MKKPNKFSPEIRELAVRMVQEHRRARHGGEDTDRTAQGAHRPD